MTKLSQKLTIAEVIFKPLVIGDKGLDLYYFYGNSKLAFNTSIVIAFIT